MRPSTSVSILTVLLPLVLAGCSAGGVSTGEPAKGGGLERACAQSRDGRLHAMGDHGIGVASARGLPSGRFALPDDPAPTQLVVLFHGNHNDSCSWRDHLRDVADKGAVAIAMDYTGQRTEGEVENYGWFVREGAVDSIIAAQHFLERYPSITTVIAFGVSMGGNASGMAVAAGATRADGAPLFDYWVDVEGANNLIEEYLILRTVAPAVPAAALALAEIEEEAGGALEEVPEAYAELTNVFRAPDMAGLKGAVIVHGVDDGLVSTSQSPEMAAALNAAGVPTHLYTVLLRGEGESGGTATGLVLEPVAGAAGETYESPFAGHGWEGSQTHLVMRTGLEQLHALMAGGTVTPGATPVPGN